MTATAHGLLEASRLIYLSYDTAALDRPERRCCRFRGGRVVDGTGAVATFSGRGPAPLDLDVPEPGGEFAEEEVSTTLRALLGAWPGRVRVQYMAKETHRAACSAGEEPRLQPARVWCLLGNVQTPAGRVVPVGFSGSGAGLEILTAEVESGRFAGLLARADRAEPLPTGETGAVLRPAAAAVLIHEALGHFAEAPPHGRVRLEHRRGFRVASELFDVDDDPLAPGGAAQYQLDDDGVPARGSTPVVRSGQLLRFLHAKDSAAAWGEQPTANGRAASAWDAALPRMSNLICHPGTASEAELLVQLGDGLLIHSLAYGFGFGFKIEAHVRLAEEVRWGRPTGRFFTGGVLDEDRLVLTRTEALGECSTFHSNAMCGKDGQLLFDVGTRAPALRLARLRTRP